MKKMGQQKKQRPTRYQAVRQSRRAEKKGKAARTAKHTYLPEPHLKRFEKNPILVARPENWWESKATFNPAAIYEAGRVHVVYRAIGDTDVSVIGYASSADGFHFDDRPNTPIYTPRKPFEGAGSRVSSPNPESIYLSGGGWCGGCEDPRLTKIDGMLYMFYVAYNGATYPRVAFTSIPLKDFLEKKWQWKEPSLVSRPGVIDKNACLLPEKIRGKYVIFHRIYPDILIDFVDDLDFDGETKWLNGEHKISPRPSHWDSRKIGVGAPPLKTSKGWLVIYQGVEEQDSSRYKMGAMLLALEDPTRVVARCEEPILEPGAWYEKHGWKSDVVYPCGAVAKDGQLLVYYGGADEVVCVATAPLEEFLKELLRTGKPKLEVAGMIASSATSNARS